MSRAKGIDVHAWQKRLREAEGLTATVRVVGFVMSTYGNYGTGRSIRVARETVAAGAGLSVKSVGKAQGELVAAGWLELVEDNSRSGNTKVNIYALSIPEWGNVVPPVEREWGNDVPPVERGVEEPQGRSGGTSRPKRGNLRAEVGEPRSHYLAIDLAPYPPNDLAKDADSQDSIWSGNAEPKVDDVKDDEQVDRWKPEALDLTGPWKPKPSDDEPVHVEEAPTARFGPRDPESISHARSKTAARWRAWS